MNSSRNILILIVVGLVVFSSLHVVKTVKADEMTFTELCRDVEVKPGCPRFKPGIYNHGDILYITDKVLFAVYEHSEIAPPEGLTGVRLELDNPYFNSSDLPLYFLGDKSSEYTVGSIVTITVHVKQYTFEDVTIITLKEWYNVYAYISGGEFDISPDEDGSQPPVEDDEKPTKADVVYHYYQIFYYDAGQVIDNVDDDLEELESIAENMIPSSPQDVALTITGVDTGWAEIAKATIKSFNLLKTAERKLILYTIEFSDPGLTNLGSYIKQDDGSYKYVDGESTPSLDIVLLDWYTLLRDEETEEAERFAEYIVLPRVLGAIWSICPASTQIKGEANDCLRQVESLTPYESEDPDFDGLKTYYESVAPGFALGTDSNNADTDGDGFIDSKDIDPLQASGSGPELHGVSDGTPGFELIIVVCAIALVLFWKQKR